MPAMKKSLLTIVQDILSDLDSEPVNSLSETLEAEQVATIVEHTFYDIIATRQVPEHKELIKIVPLSDSEFPTHFHYPDNVNKIEKIWYDISNDSTLEYREVHWCDPVEFLRITDRRQDFQAVKDKSAGTQLRIYNDRHPEFYTSFDDFHIVMDGFDNTIDDTLQESKVRAFGIKYPVFNRFDDDYVPDLDSEYFPYLIREATSRCFDMLKGGTTQKVEQAARRAKVHLQNDRFRTERPNNWNNFGRKQ